jgi:hypothetical protein
MFAVSGYVSFLAKTEENIRGLRGPSHVPPKRMAEDGGMDGEVVMELRVVPISAPK